MAQTYAEFKTYLTTFLWKNGDAVVTNNLDNLIRLANAELGRKMKSEARHASDDITVDALDKDLPSDYDHIEQVTVKTLIMPPFKYITRGDMRALRNTTPTSIEPFYSLSNDTIMFSGPIESSPVEVTVDYYRTIPDYSVTDTSWVEDEYLDLYTYCVLKHASTFIREDERLPIWTGMYVDALESVNEEAEWDKKRGTIASQPLPRQAGIIRRR